jgi:hypothetical protein
MFSCKLVCVLSHKRELNIDYSSNPNPNPIGLLATMFVWCHGHENTYTLLEVI